MLRVCFICIFAVAASARSPVLDPFFHVTSNLGFCSPGAFRATVSAPPQPRDLKTWGSFCAAGDQTTGQVETSAFTAPSAFGLYIAGYLGPRLTLEVENIANGSRLPILPDRNPREQWVEYEIRLPSSWAGASLRLIGRDEQTGSGGWFAFSEPIRAKSIRYTNNAIELLARAFLHFVLTFLPAFAVAVLAVRRGLRNVIVTGLLMLFVIGAVGYSSFWLWFGNRTLGRLFSLYTPFIFSGVIVWGLRHVDAAGRRIIRRLLVPVALAGLASMLFLSLGFLYGGVQTPLQTAWTRFFHQLPPDNTIPYTFAEGVREGHIPKPLIGDWRSSDRPPLQTGLVLSHYAFAFRPRDLDYTVSSVLLQSLWIFAGWLLLTAFEIDRLAMTLALAACLFSGFVALNTFYVWPKLLAAAFMLACLTMLITPCQGLLRGKTFCIITAGLLAFGLLAHGGSAFALLGAVLTLAVLPKRAPLKRLLLVAVAAFLLYMPWMLYQRLYDPPGNRLLNMHLAGVDDVDTRPFGKILLDAYSHLTPQQIIAAKIGNVKTLFRESGDFWKGLGTIVLHFGDLASATQRAGDMRGWMFFFFAANMGILMVGPIGLAAGLRRKTRLSTHWRATRTIWLYVGLTLLAWCLCMFKPGSTSVHQGTYAAVLLAFMGSIFAVWLASRWGAALLASLHVAVTILLYVVLVQPYSTTALSAREPWDIGLVIVCVLALLGILWMFVSVARTADVSRHTERRESSPKFSVN